MNNVALRRSRLDTDEPPESRRPLNLAPESRRWRVQVTITAVLLVGLLSWIDHVTGPDKSFLMFYSLLIAAVGWRAGRGPMIIVALSAAAASAIAGATGPGSEPLDVVLWNAFNRLAIFLAIGLLTHLLTRESQLARQDALTGLDNLRSLREYLARQRRQTDLPCAVISMDVDDFKHVNDRFGHATGDQLLAQIGEILKHSVRTDEIAARVGGDEFVVLLKAVTREQVESIVDRIKERIEALTVGAGREGVRVSVGIAYIEGGSGQIEGFLANADRALYEAKGRKGATRLR